MDYIVEPGVIGKSLVALAGILLGILLWANPASAETFTVTNTNDSGEGSLRSAITLANLNPDADKIDFAIPGEGVKTINAASTFEIEYETTIDGYTQDGAKENTLAVGSDAKLLIEIKGAALVFYEKGTVRGLVINSSPNGIYFNGDNSVAEGNYIGTNTSGSRIVRATCESFCEPKGVLVEGENALIGGTNPAARNVIAGIPGYRSGLADGYGIMVAGTATVQGNYIGTDASGTKDLGNESYGIYVGSGSATVGGIESGAGNLISGNNGGVGVTYAGKAEIMGNLIGTDATGTRALGNDGPGVGLFDGSGEVTVGGAEPGNGNVISGNGVGVYVSERGNAKVQGNKIGTDASGQEAVGNDIGVRLDRSGDILIGGTTDGAGNVISGNERSGIYSDFGSSNRVQGNLIGADASGEERLGNGANGIYVDHPDDFLIGGTSEGAGNVISGNGSYGIRTPESAYIGVIVQGNYIGLNERGTKALGNVDSGVRGEGIALIGGTAKGAGNVISGNGENGIVSESTQSTSNIRGNLIGTDASGRKDVGNRENGILVRYAFDTQEIGGESSGANTIAFNDGAGIRVLSLKGYSDGESRISGNSIFGNGELGIDTEREGVNPVVRFDPDRPNRVLANYPALASVKFSNGTTTVTGNLTGTSDRRYVIRFFASSVADASGYGEGEIYLGKTTVETNEKGRASFTFKSKKIIRGQFITATAMYVATGEVGADKTSEFSRAVKVR